MQVLLIDDNVVFLQQLKKYLITKNISVDTADGGNSALDMMEKNHYDIVVLDLKMPDLPGVDVLRWARQHNVKSKFIILTGYGDVETAVKTMKLGASEYIQKPFKAEELFNLLTEVNKRKPLLPDAFSSDDPKEWLKRICMNRYVFLVTETNPKKFEKDYGIIKTEHIWLNENSREDVNGKTKFTILENLIGRFTDKYQNATVVHKGISRLLDIYGNDALQDYISRICTMAKEKEFQLVMIHKSPDEKKILQTMQGMPFFLNVEEIAKILGSVVRCGIIQLLNTNKTLRYSDLMKEMDIGLSSDLAFHLKKLQDWNVISKDNEKYILTPHGHYFADVLGMLLTGSYRDPSSNVIYCQL